LRLRAMLAVSGNGTIDQPRIDRLHGIEAQAEAAHHAGAELLDEDVRAPQQRTKPRDGAGLFKVDGNAALAAVEHGEVGAVGAELRPITAHLVALAGALDLDDL